MPRFFFDICEDGKLQEDEEGVDLASFEEARKEAQHILPQSPMIRFEIMETTKFSLFS